MCDASETGRNYRYVVRQLSSRTRHRVLAMAALDQKPEYGLITLTYQRYTAVLLLIYGSLFLSGIY